MILFSICSLAVVIAISTAAHEFGHWIVGQAYGINGHLHLFQGDAFALIMFDCKTNILIKAAGGLFGFAAAGALLVLVLGLIKNLLHQTVFKIVCAAVMLGEFVYLIDETFKMSGTIEHLYYFAALVLFAEIVTLGIRRLYNEQVI